ncbi:hypothetical protein Sango_2106600 [Sesamum angolense]|uniref:Uncharacterized protein n=1 Tax=Sesamum angolense TaxID=2727404 RepID=A0AAE1WBP5_9LAMI|nr:hypothetical protein Sango_2106600 [Sesamum angolense]
MNVAGQDPPREQSSPRGIAPYIMNRTLSMGRSPYLANNLHPRPTGEQPPPHPPLPCSTLRTNGRGAEAGEVNNRVSQPEVQLQTQEQTSPLIEVTLYAPSPPSKGAEDPYLLLATTPPRCSSFAPAIMAKVLPSGVKVLNLSKYDENRDPQERPDKFYAKIDWYELSDAAYCMIFRTTLSKAALKENEPLRDYVRRFVEVVHELAHVNYELLVSIIQQNLLSGRFKESITGKPPSTLEDLLMQSQKYIKIEESNASDPSFAIKRKGKDEDKEPRNKGGKQTLTSGGFHTLHPLNTFRGEILFVVEQQ